MSTFQKYTTDGVTNAYPIPFEYLNEAYVKAIVNGEAAGGSINAGFFELDTPPEAGSTLYLYRDTPVAPLVVFSDRTTIEEGSLDLVVKQLADSIEETQSGFYSVISDTIPDITDPDYPQTPTNVVATALFSAINVQWDRPSFTGFKYTEVWRSATDDFDTAILINTTISTQISDTVGYDEGYYYWVRHVNTNNVTGALHSTSGVFAETSESFLNDDLLMDIIMAPTVGVLDQLSNANAQLALVTEQLSGTHGHLITVDDRVNDAEFTILAHEQSITQLETDVQNLDVSGNASAVSALDVRVTATENSITTQAADITALQSDLGTLNGTVSGQATAISDLETSLTATDGVVSGHSTDITQLQTDVAAIDLGSATSAINALDTRVTQNETDLTAQSNSLTSLSASVASVESDASGNATAITALDSRVTANEGSLTTQSGRITAIESELTTFDTAGTALLITSIDTRVTANEGSITSHGSRLTSIENELTAFDTTAQASAISTLQSDLTITNSNVSALSTTQTALNTTVGDHTATLALHGASINGLEAQWDVKTNVNDLVGGIGLYNDGNTTRFYVDTNYALIGGTLTSPLIQTDSSGNERIEVDSTDNSIKCYLDDGEFAGLRELVDIGRAVGDGDGNDYIAVIGDGDTAYRGLSVRSKLETSIYAYSAQKYGVYAISSGTKPAVKARSDTGTPCFEGHNLLGIGMGNQVWPCLVEKTANIADYVPVKIKSIKHDPGSDFSTYLWCWEIEEVYQSSGDDEIFGIVAATRPMDSDDYFQMRWPLLVQTTYSSTHDLCWVFVPGPIVPAMFNTSNGAISIGSSMATTSSSLGGLVRSDEGAARKIIGKSLGTLTGSNVTGIKPMMLRGS